MLLKGNRCVKDILKQCGSGHGSFAGLEALGKDLHSVTAFSELQEIQRQFPGAGTSSPATAPLLTLLMPMLAEWNIDPRWLRECPVLSVRACACVLYCMGAAAPFVAVTNVKKLNVN